MGREGEWGKGRVGEMKVADERYQILLIYGGKTQAKAYGIPQGIKQIWYDSKNTEREV